jgi:hypothetical protein
MKETEKSTMLQQHSFKKKGLKKRRRRDDEKIAHKLELNKQVGEIYKKNLEKE